MKSRVTAIPVLLAAGVLLFLAACTSTKTPLPTDNIDELVGTWVNTGYNIRAQKIIIEPDGVFTAYKKVDYTSYMETGTLELIEKWADAKGNILYKSRFDSAGNLVYELGRISSAGTVLEYVQSYKDYPTEIDPGDLEYRIYYRQ